MATSWDRENNLATINLSSDPAAGLVERVTNAIDAVLEREWVQRGSQRISGHLEKPLRYGLEFLKGGSKT